MRNSEKNLLIFCKKALVERTIRRLDEANIEDLSDICFVGGSTHKMATCKIGSDKYFLKFSDEDLFDNFDPSLQILIEYLAYKIYGLYSGIKIPRPELVYDRTGQRVGLATSPAPGKPVTVYDPAAYRLGRAMSEGVYVDIFLANWDVVGTGTANVFLDDEAATRIDPGGSLTFRAQGGRKGQKFSRQAGELKTMLDPSFGGAGRVFQYSDLAVAAREFLKVPWQRIADAITLVDEEISYKLGEIGMQNLRKQWREDVATILDTLEPRHEAIRENAEMILSQS